MMGLYASFWLTVLMAFIGGRPGMISAAAGSMAMVIVSLVRDYGPEYLMAATILCGVIMTILGLLKVGNLIKLIPNSVNIGFVNALGIMIFMSQLGNFEGEGWRCMRWWHWALPLFICSLVLPESFRLLWWQLLW